MSLLFPLLLHSPPETLRTRHTDADFAFVVFCFQFIQLIITIGLWGWGLLGMFLWLAFSCRGYECQDFSSTCDAMKACICRLCVTLNLSSERTVVVGVKLLAKAAVVGVLIHLHATNVSIV